MTAPQGAALVIADTAAHDIVVETDDVRAVFSTAGATLKSWKLKHYLDGAREPLELDSRGPSATRCRGRSRSSTDDPAISATTGDGAVPAEHDGLSLGFGAGHAELRVPRRVRA